MYNSGYKIILPVLKYKYAIYWACSITWVCSETTGFSGKFKRKREKRKQKERDIIEKEREKVRDRERERKGERVQLEGSQSGGELCKH